MNRSLTNFARQSYCTYRNGPIRVGHSLIRRLLDPVLDRHQTVQLACGLKLALDMSKGNQNAIFWHDGNGDVNMYWAVRELVPLGGLFIDCGANCGLVGLLARQYRQARVIFLEPHPRLVQTVAANIKLNGFESDCELIPAAVSDTGGEISFYEDPRHDGSHSVLADWGGQMRLLGQVPCLTLSEIIETRRLSKIHFLKIDTEGNDWAVLKSAGSHLRPGIIEVVYVEMSRDQEAISRLLQDRGYMGFVNISRRRRASQLAKQAYENGGQPCFFAPLPDSSPPEGDVLWCGRESSQAAYLNALHSRASL